MLHVQPYLRLLTLRYPVDDLLVSVRSANGSSASSANNASVACKRRHVRQVAALAPRSIWLAVHRQESTVWYKPLSEEEFRLLTALSSGQPWGGPSMRRWLKVRRPKTSAPRPYKKLSATGPRWDGSHRKFLKSPEIESQRWEENQ